MITRLSSEIKLQLNVLFILVKFNEIKDRNANNNAVTDETAIINNDLCSCYIF